MEERLKALEGMTEKEWEKMKTIVDTTFYEIRQKNTFNITEGTLNHMNIIFQKEL